jgi:hypothetical protein
MFRFEAQVLWYQHSWENEIKKSRTSCAVSFLHRSGCAFVYQPTVPVTTLIIEPRWTMTQIFLGNFHGVFLRGVRMGY